MNLKSTSPHLVAIDLSRRRLIVHDAKGQKGRVVYLSYHAVRALDDYLTVRPALSTQRVFSVEKGTNRNESPIGPGIQKRMVYYAKRTGL
jgi:site-specific recombinase XerD